MKETDYTAGKRSSSIEGQISESGYLMLSDFNAVKNDITLFDKNSNFRFNLMKNRTEMGFSNDGVTNKTVLQSLNESFMDHQAALLISSSK